MALAVWLPLLFLSSLLACHSYTLIETYQLFNLLQTSGAPLHIIEVSGINEVDSPLLQHIPKARCMSLKELSDLSMWPLVKMPRQEDFVARMKSYGLKLDATPVVLYDRSGLFFAAKAWWILTVFGRDYVFVLNGGLPKWIHEGYVTLTGQRPPLLDPLTQNSAEYGYRLDLKRMWTIRDLVAFSGTMASPLPTVPIQLLDVRAKADFDATSVKGSINMPIEIVRRADGTLRSAIELRTIFQMYAVSMRNDTLTVVIGVNGIDSSMALLSLSVVGNDHSAMVDGGWLEYSEWLKRSGPGSTGLKAAAYTVDTEPSTSFSPLLIFLPVGLLLCVLPFVLQRSKKRMQPLFSEKWL